MHLLLERLPAPDFRLQTSDSRLQTPDSPEGLHPPPSALVTHIRFHGWPFAFAIDNVHVPSPDRSRSTLITEALEPHAVNRVEACIRLDSSNEWRL